MKVDTKKTITPQGKSARHLTLNLCGAAENCYLSNDVKFLHPEKLSGLDLFGSFKHYCLGCPSNAPRGLGTFEELV
jgi:hypothetical protein